jgi:hypothetical protein
VKEPKRVRGREKLADSVYVERYLAVTRFMAEHADATVGHTCSVLNIPVNGYYKGKELVDKGYITGVVTQNSVYTELTEPVFYLGSWFIPQLTYPITPKLRS